MHIFGSRAASLDPFAKGLALTAALICAVAIHPARAGVGGWVDGDHVRARLAIAGLDQASGNIIGAVIELIVPAGWKTYWRTPGAGGVPPRFDFSGSRNLLNARVLYPPPHRLQDGTGISNVYTGRILLPVEARVSDTRKPLRLQAKIDLGVCEQVCIPVQLNLMADSGLVEDFRARALVTEARKALPGPPEPTAFEVASIARTGGSDNRPEFDLAAIVPPGADPVVFVEGPESWFAGAPKPVGREGNRVTFHFSIDRSTSKVALPGTKLHVTMVAGERAIEQDIGFE